MDIVLEIPLDRRDYEQQWEMSIGLNRLSVSLDYEAFPMQKFTQYLKWIAQENGTMCVEIDELYSNEKSLLKALDIDHDAINSVQENIVVQKPADRSINLYKYDKYFYSIIFSENLETLEALLLLECQEFFITFWGNKTPRVISAGSNESPVERLYLSQLGEFDPVVFLSPNHEHMEIMSLDEKLLIESKKVVYSSSNNSFK